MRYTFCKPGFRIAATICLSAVASVPLLVSTGDEFIAYKFSRNEIYHSPQIPGYTCWTGAWIMPDASLMVSFTQATGPLEGRPRMPEWVHEKLGWPISVKPGYDFTGLDLANIYLRSYDGGDTWERVGTDPFQTPGGQMSQGGPQIALPNETIVRAVFGYHLPLNLEIPKTGFLQRSTDGARSWGPPQVLLDADRFTYRVTRLRWLRDGRMVALGGIASVPPSKVTEVKLTDLWRPLLLVSEDEGESWSAPIVIASEKEHLSWGGEEWDVAELANGDLLAVFRRAESKGSPDRKRWQALLKKRGKSWVATRLQRSVLPHSGHPELLASREGPVLHIATTGTHWTQDAGQTWHELAFDELDAPYRTRYYPHSLQTDDGTIYVFAHFGAHDPFGKDQHIVMDKFRLSPRSE
jgi:hypothetical protein